MGQRVARKSTMWPYWAVLWKDLLMLYLNLGEVSVDASLLGLSHSVSSHKPALLQPKPLDVVLLVRAQIRQLAGGRTKQDVERGFAIIESGGTARYFVVSSAPEYVHWIRAISTVTGNYNDASIEDPISRDKEKDSII